MIKLLGIPFDANSSFLRGAAGAPNRIRQMDLDGSANAFSESGDEICSGKTFEDLGDLNFSGPDPVPAFAAIRNAIEKELAAGNKVLSLGGDHSVSHPILDAYLEKYPGLHILHLDAHADLYDNFDGNPYSHASPFARIMEIGRAGSLVQAGIRTLNSHQRLQAEKFRVTIHEMRDLSTDFAASLQGPLYISLDLDVLDPAFAPGVSHHEPGGMSSRELLQILRNIRVPVLGADIVEYNPVRDFQNMTAMLGYKLLKELVSLMMQ
jgi:arginase